MADDAMEGRVLGRYQLLRKIASGGMATVYAARVVGAAGFERLVALKLMLPEIADDPELVRMFLDEARVAAHVRSPYAVATLDLGQDDQGLPYIVMDLVVGCSLAELLRWSLEQGRVLPVPAVVEIIQHAARGLHDAHQASTTLGQPLRIVHRDVSPQNVMVGLDGTSRITDFGVAHAVERLTKTQGISLKGKAAYCSPEQARGDPLDGRSDVFSLGIVAWEALTQRRLFHDQNVGLTVKNVTSMEVENPCRIRDRIPPELGEIVLRALSKDPSDRYPTALQFAEAVRRTMPDPVLSDEVRDVVRLVGGPSIRALVDDIQEAVAASASPGAAHRWDDSPTVVERPSFLPEVSRETLGTNSLNAIVSNPALYESLSEDKQMPTRSLRPEAFTPAPERSAVGEPETPKKRRALTPLQWAVVALVCALAAGGGVALMMRMLDASSAGAAPSSTPSSVAAPASPGAPESAPPSGEPSVAAGAPVAAPQTPANEWHLASEPGQGLVAAPPGSPEAGSSLPVGVYGADGIANPFVRDPDPSSTRMQAVSAGVGVHDPWTPSRRRQRPTMARPPPAGEVLNPWGD
ncbi:MAG: protein kinase [Myxococcota bacterium]